MPVFRSPLSALCLLGAVPFLLAPHYHSLDARYFDYHGHGSFVDCRSVQYVPDGSGVVSMVGQVRSEAGTEDVVYVESNAWLHGAATIKSLPKSDASLSLTLYDEAGATLLSFSCSLGAAGGVTLTADATKETSACDVATKSGCSDVSASAAIDVELLGAEVFGASGAMEVGFDLAGADIYAVAYGVVTVTEGKTATRTEVGWDEAGAIWEAELAVEPIGAVEVKSFSYDKSGELLGERKFALGLPWVTEGQGINSLAVDEDPLTTVGFATRVDVLPDGRLTYASRDLVVHSSGWTLGDELPATAQVELSGGETLSVPVNSYHRGGTCSYGRKGELCVLSGLVRRSGTSLTIRAGDVVFTESSDLSVFDSPVCVGGACFMLADDGEDGLGVNVSVYGELAEKLPDDLEFTLSITDKSGATLFEEEMLATFDDEISAVFANEVSFAADPTGLGLSGKVSLLGAPDKKGKESTLAKGKFSGGFTRDGDGELALAAADKGEVVARGDILIGGEPIGFELTEDTDKDGVLSAPPLTSVRPLFANESAYRVRVHRTRSVPERKFKL